MPIQSCVLNQSLLFHLCFINFKSHSLRKSDTSQYGLEIEKIDFSETLPIFNLY